MKLPLPSSESFSIRDVIIGGETCKLINPLPRFKEWTEELMNYRSVILDSQLNVISAGLPKATNEGERADLRKLPDNILDVHWIEKMDGSCILVSKPFLNHLLIRTRGSHTVDQHATGAEVRGLIREYKIDSIFDQCSGNYTLVFEHVTPSHKIVLNYAKPDLIFIGKISHDNYKLNSQWALDQFAKIYLLKRPKVYNFMCAMDVEQIANWQTEDEGVVAYYDNDQKMVKVKTDKYKRLHALKASFGSMDRLIDEWFLSGANDCASFYNYMVKIFDYEVAEFVRPKIVGIAHAIHRINNKIIFLLSFIKHYEYNTQKEYARAVQQEHSKELWSILFELRQKAGCLSEQTKRKWLEREVTTLGYDQASTAAK